jgi:hypothetical protein
VIRDIDEKRFGLLPMGNKGRRATDDSASAALCPSTSLTGLLNQNGVWLRK